VPIRRRRVTVRSLAAATPLAARCD
jgi:hypothetical protein